jgi:hypothetical protein
MHRVECDVLATEHSTNKMKFQKYIIWRDVKVGRGWVVRRMFKSRHADDVQTGWLTNMTMIGAYEW